MGEITDALRRARSEPKLAVKAREPEAEPAPDEQKTDYRALLRQEVTAPPPPKRSTALATDKIGGAWLQRAVVVDGEGPVAESFRHAALRLRRALDQRRARSFAVVSAMRDEGKTTVACNLSLALASLSRSRSVALVDFDLRNPSVARCLGLPAGPGVEEALRGTRSLDEVCVTLERPTLEVYPTRRAHQDAHEILVQSSFETLVRELERRYEVVVFDTPPVLLVPDAAMIVERVGAAVAVARAGRTARRGFQHMLELLPPDKLIGCILNEGSLPARAQSYGYYGEEPSAAKRD